jgi:uncharacterized protein (TIGR03083 family)
MTTTPTESASSDTMSHDRAMKLAEVEIGRMIDVVDQLRPPDWSLPTDCEGWDVKALLSHQLGAMEGNASLREFVRQYLVATKKSKRSGRPLVDEMTASQVSDHAPLSPGELADRLRDKAQASVRGRRRMPALMRAMPISPGAPFEGTWKLRYLVDTIMNRDFWMHRVDLTRATGLAMVLTPEHDGVIVGDVVREWARTHGQPFTLVLEGLAGGAFTQGQRGEEITLDAVEFCRVLSGRGHGSGLLSEKVPF